MGALVAAGVLFRRFERKYLDDVPRHFCKRNECRVVCEH